MSDKLKKLTGKNSKDFEPAAYNLINIPDVELFAELVSQEDFLFDFIKQNVASRLAKVCNKSNYRNLLSLLKYYSSSYEEFIISTLVKFADEDLTDNMLEIFETGTDDEKTYCAKFFSYIQDPLAIEALKANSYNENSCLSANCAATLAVLGDKDSYNEALEKLCSNDEFEKLDGVKFLVSYGNKNAVPKIIETIKTSSLAENIAGELLYLTDIFEILEDNQTDGLLVLNLIINGLGEILGLSQIIDFGLYEIFEYFLSKPINSRTAVVLMNAKDKFQTLTENDEYLFDESKETKQEIYDIKNLINSCNGDFENLIEDELNEKSLFVFTAMDFTTSTEKIRSLLNAENQTVVLKAIEILNKLNNLTPQDKITALSNISDENIKNVIKAI